VDILNAKHAREYLACNPRASLVRIAAEGVERAGAIAARQGNEQAAERYNAAAAVLRKHLKHTHAGVTYYRDFAEAENIARAFNRARVVSFERGWAVQAYVSGPYWNEKEDAFL